MNILNIKDWVLQEKAQLSSKILSMDNPPSLAIIYAGNDEASYQYAKGKKKDCDEIGINCEIFHIYKTATFEDFIKTLDRIIGSEKFTHLIIERPLPAQLEEMWFRIEEIIPFDMDIDGFTSESPYEPCTPYGIVKYLKACGMSLDGANITIIGRSNIVGRPLARMLINENATITLCHSHTKNIQEHVKNADAVVVAVGKADFFDATWASNAQIIVDVGINFKNGKMVGDVRNPNERTTPVPGGVGILTRLALLDQMVNGGKRND